MTGLDQFATQDWLYSTLTGDSQIQAFPLDGQKVFVRGGVPPSATFYIELDPPPAANDTETISGRRIINRGFWTVCAVDIVDPQSDGVNSVDRALACYRRIDQLVDRQGGSSDFGVVRFNRRQEIAQREVLSDGKVAVRLGGIYRATVRGT
jgi:hypothetical protein